MGITICECERYEADDILGTISRIADKNGVDALLVTGDRDALQLINDHTHVLLTKKGITETVEYDEAALKEQYGLEPARMPDLKGLMGDNSDNLPGIPGVGEKTGSEAFAKIRHAGKHAAKRGAGKRRAAPKASGQSRIRPYKLPAGHNRHRGAYICRP